MRLPCWNRHLRWAPGIGRRPGWWSAECRRRRRDRMRFVRTREVLLLDDSIQSRWICSAVVPASIDEVEGLAAKGRANLWIGAAPNERKGRMAKRNMNPKEMGRTEETNRNRTRVTKEKFKRDQHETQWFWELNFGQPTKQKQPKILTTTECEANNNVRRIVVVVVDWLVSDLIRRVCGSGRKCE